MDLPELVEYMDLPSIYHTHWCRVHEMVKRARTAKVHALVCACLEKILTSPSIQE